MEHCQEQVQQIETRPNNAGIHAKGQRRSDTFDALYQANSRPVVISYQLKILPDSADFSV